MSADRGARRAAPWRRGAWLVAVLACLLLPSCQWLQNEFFFLDAARPVTEPEEDASRPW